MEGGDGSDVSSASQAGEPKGDVPVKDDILLLADEKFDFDLSLSSSSANEDDEVFFGPVGHKERCIAASLDLNNQIPEEPLLPASENCFTWSPLTGEKFVEVYKEAHLLALQIESNSKNKVAQAAKPENSSSQGVERFIQESKLKINLFEKGNEMKKSPRSLKRETYYLSDSPLRGLPPSGTQPPPRVALHSAPAQASLPQRQGPPHSSRSSLPVEPSTAHPPNQAVTQKKVISKLLPPRASSVRGKNIHLAMEQLTKEKPASPCRMKILNEKESHRDMPPDKPSTAQDVTSLPASGSHLVQGKRSLPVPSKLGLRKTLLKPPGCAGSLERKPSSLGCVSGMTSSVSAAPAAGKAKSSELPSSPADSSRPLSNTSQLGRMGHAVSQPSLQAGPAGVSCRQSRWAEVADLTAEQPRAPPTSPLIQLQTPEQGGPRLSSHSGLSQSSQLNTAGRTGRRDSFLNSKTKVMPTPTNQFKIPKFSTGEHPGSATPKFSRAQRLQSCTSVGRVTVHSTPARRSSGPASQSLLSSARTPVSARRISALPTPVSRRLAGLPLVTPKTTPRILASPLCVSTRRLSSEPRKKSASRTSPRRESNSKAASGCSDLSSDESFSPPSAVPQALSFSPEKSDFTFSKSATTEVALDEAQPPEDAAPSEAVLVDIKLDQLIITPKADSTPLIDLPLIDLCNTSEANLALGSESRPLIDLLTNTPDMNRNAALKPLHEVAQLIDLASPLIQLSPEADKENTDSPLLKF
ncbi:PREDICTED: G2 and S phase-expressed protein 1 [Ceratotherium simum simum]|uniref:G2 and S phase-expressed protein 1 n=1 Tax=Ceratotherium simum simum TaxID=73337 RepID=A0ABM1DAE9_CERSS|nr:PREDICTED: G2 and S phase-expressed protein 1 [Ceratotherium simum simum]